MMTTWLSVVVMFQAANIGLADLDLSWNCISGKGGVAICKALTVSHLQLPVGELL